MRPIHLFDITSRHNQWLAARQSVIASNIANANTPGYEAVDLQAFSHVLDATSLEMAASARGHQIPDTTASVTTSDARNGGYWDIVHSGNSVSMEKELMKSSEITGAYSLNTSIAKSFHRMMLTSTRSSA
jgi:flagellar basal-body rod protein FlgB